MRIALFCRSLLSDLDHGSARFLRGVAAELDARGHDVLAFEPLEPFASPFAPPIPLDSARRARRAAFACGHAAPRDAAAAFACGHAAPPDAAAAHACGHAAPRDAAAAYPRLSPRRYALATLDLDAALEDVDVALVHEGTDPELVRRLGEHRARTDGYHLFFHDARRRLLTDPPAIVRRDLAGYDCVLGSGKSLCEMYLSRGVAPRAVVWREAADARLFRPRPGVEKERDLVWIGDWEDGEQAAALRELLIGPARALGLRARVHGAGYPERARAELAEAGIELAGWLPSHLAPDAFARARVAVHIPPRPRGARCGGAPALRPLEALACGVPLVSAPWPDVERLLAPGRDYLVARTGAEMTEHLRALLSDPGYARGVAEHGRRTVLARHTCAHRVDTLLDLVDELLLELPGLDEDEDLDELGPPSGVRRCRPAHPRSPLA
ncbi:CgeB family protein [Sorangium sp. So ce1024]|uniref:CgeB family protein n=1 Tax=Sorangium sp. So ce1024 TaxID=3133327 RepID=UPI003F003596